MKTLRISLAVALAIAAMVLTGCCTHRKGATGLGDMSFGCDSAATALTGDSIYTVLMKAKKIVAIDKSTSLPKDCDSVKVLKPDAAAALRLIIENPENYRSDIPVYGLFKPSMEYRFSQGKRSVTILYDFGLGKWGIADASGKLLLRRDLSNDDALRFSRRLFPKDTLLEAIEKK